jgi:hypothetical protein
MNVQEDGAGRVVVAGTTPEPELAVELETVEGLPRDGDAAGWFWHDGVQDAGPEPGWLQAFDAGAGGDGDFLAG